MLLRRRGALRPNHFPARLTAPCRPSPRSFGWLLWIALHQIAARRCVQPSFSLWFDGWSVVERGLVSGLFRPRDAEALKRLDQLWCGVLHTLKDDQAPAGCNDAVVQDFELIASRETYARANRGSPPEAQVCGW